MVDNGSQDGSVDHVRAAYRDVRVLELGSNRGWPGGNNAAIAATAAPWLLLLNNDTSLRPGCLETLMAAGEADATAGMVQPKLVFRDRPAVIQSAGTILLGDGSAGDRGAGETDQGQFDRAEEVFAACGAAMLLRREVVSDVGAFDETFFAYYEDTDLAWRMRLRGWRALYEPAAVVEHVHAATNLPSSSYMRFHADRNRLFMVLKNAPWSFVRSSFSALGGRGLAAGSDAAAGRGRGHRQRVAGSFAAHLPEMLWKRRAIRSRRTVPDADILRWAVPRAEWDARVCA